jgi:hypothetical protein
MKKYFVTEVSVYRFARCGKTLIAFLAISNPDQPLSSLLTRKKGLKDACLNFTDKPRYRRPTAKVTTRTFTLYLLYSRTPNP